MLVLSVDKLAYVVRTRMILEDINFQVNEGEVLGLLGPSGAGKSTLARIIAGMLVPTEGEIKLEGQHLLTVPACQRKIGFQQQGFPLYPHMTVARNVQVALEGAGVAESQVAGKVEAVLNAIGISSSLWQRKPGNLSGGEAQRVAFAKTLLKNSRLLILDEPFSNLNKELRLQLGRLVRDQVRQRNQGCIYISHDEHDLVLVSDRIAVMEDGKLTQADAIEHMLLVPRTARAAGIASELGLQWLTKEEWVSVTANSHDSLPSMGLSEYDRVAWRPDDAQVSAKEDGTDPSPDNGHAEMSVIVKRVITVGRQYYYAVKVPSQATDRELWCTAWGGCAKNSIVSEGARVKLRIPHARLLYLDKNDRVL